MGVAARFGATAMAHGVPREVTVADPEQVYDPRRPTHSLVSMELRHCWRLAAPRQVGCVVRQSESHADRQAPRRFRKVEEGVYGPEPSCQYHR